MQCFGSHSLLSPAGGRPTQDAQELRRAMARSEIARVSVNASATSAGARHTSCARGLRPAASRRKEPPMSNNKDTLALHAHTMRGAPTESEARLWRALRSSQLGVAFRRQVPLLGFIADFYAPSARLIVEVDGAYHARRLTADARRDRKLARAGYRVLRLPAELVMRDLPAALRAVQNALDER